MHEGSIRGIKERPDSCGKLNLNKVLVNWIFSAETSLKVETRSNLKTLDDPLKKVYSYETGLRKPLLILMDDRNCINSQTVNDTEIAEVFSSLNLGD